MSRKLKELGPDVNADPEILPPSGRLYRHPGERAAKQYIPVKTPKGDFLIVAAQGEKDYDKVRKIGRPFLEGVQHFHRDIRRARAALYEKLKSLGHSDPRQGLYANVVHVNPTDSGALVRGSGELEGDERDERDEREEDREIVHADATERAAGRVSRRSGGDGYAIAQGEADGELSVGALRKQLRSYGASSSMADRSVRKAMIAQIRRLAKEGSDRRGFRSANASSYQNAFEARAMNRLENSTGPSGSLSRLGEGREKLLRAQEEISAYVLQRKPDSERERWVLDSLRRFATTDIPFRIAQGQIAIATQTLKSMPTDLRKIGSHKIAEEFEEILRKIDVKPSGELSKGTRAGLLAAGLGALIVGTTAIVHVTAKKNAARPA